jgi:hypothetical protein
MSASDHLSGQFGKYGPPEAARAEAKSRRDYRQQLMGQPAERIQSVVDQQTARRDAPGSLASMVPDIHASLTAHIRGAQNELARQSAGMTPPRLSPRGIES